jgi:peptidoglycan hydrolase-like amidase
MLVAARTYARWYMEYSTKWAAEGFHLLSTSSSQIYRGYDYEKDHDTIPDLARRTNGIVMKNSEGDFVLAAYCSWSDGSTRKYEDGHWGGTCREKTSGSISSVYPELSAVNDPYGKHPTLGTCALAASGNHMVGMIANGSLIMARDHDKSYTAILSHYYHDISIIKEY